MPTYEFRCPNGHDFEKFFRKMSDAATDLPCPECGASAARRVSGGAGLLFKGSGFYLTDYGKDAHRKPAPSAPAKDEAKGGDAKPDGAAPKSDSSSGKGGSATSETKIGQGKGGSGTSGAGGE